MGCWPACLGRAHRRCNRLRAASPPSSVPGSVHQRPPAMHMMQCGLREALSENRDISNYSKAAIASPCVPAVAAVVFLSMNPHGTEYPRVEHLPFTITAGDGEPLYADARFPAGETGPLPAVVFVHGFKGFKDWGSIPYICSRLAQHGFATIAFNFSHNGIEGHSEEFTRLDRFQRNTFSREVREVHEVVDAIASGNVPHAERINREAIGMVGHSRGGGIAILAAEADARVRALATWAAVADFNRYTPRQVVQWRRDGFMESKNMRTGQMMRLGLELLEDLEQHAGALDIGAAAARFGRPLLILHGEQDLSVRIEDGIRLAELAPAATSRFIPIPRTNHTFGAEHPFNGPNPVLDSAIETTAEFLREHCTP